jgi:hypothetical protein
VLGGALFPFPPVPFARGAGAGLVVVCAVGGGEDFVVVVVVTGGVYGGAEAPPR